MRVATIGNQRGERSFKKRKKMTENLASSVGSPYRIGCALLPKKVNVREDIYMHNAEVWQRMSLQRHGLCRLLYLKGNCG